MSTTITSRSSLMQRLDPGSAGVARERARQGERSDALRAADRLTELAGRGARR